MRNYEIAYISVPDLDDQSLGELEERVTGWVVAADGEVLEVDRWGKRRLAYPIRDHSDGIYTFIAARMPSEAGEAVERNLRLTESILRYMVTVRTEE
jgi:small subunit ribosomal protein S6